ncbi:hypothetical protein NMG60_11026807 [Bertholletia excelsa]
MSDCQSFGSNCHQCSQPRKISIGVMMNSAKRRPITTREGEAAGATVEKVLSMKVNCTDGGNLVEGVKDAIMGQAMEGTDQKTSQWVSTRSCHPTKLTSTVVQHANLTDASGICNELNGAKTVPTVIANQMSLSQYSDCVQKHFDKVSFRTKGGTVGTKEMIEELSFATIQESFVPEREVLQDKTNRTQCRREVLRTKLFEILETVSSPIKEVPQDPDAVVNNVNLKQGIDVKSKAAQPRQASDPIESDSESSDHTLARPTIRSLTRNRAPSEIQRNKIRNLTSSHSWKHLEKNILSFEEGFCQRLEGVSSKFFRKKRERKGFRTELCKPTKDNAEKFQPAAHMNKATKNAENVLSYVNRRGSCHNRPPENSDEFVELENGVQKKDSLQFPAMNTTDQQGHKNNSTFAEHRPQKEVSANSSLKNTEDPYFAPQSPTFEIRELTKSFSPVSPHKKNCEELDDHTPINCRFNGLLASKPDYHQPDVGMKSSEDAEELEDSSPVKLMTMKQERDAQDTLSRSSSEEKESESSKKGSLINEGQETESISPGTGVATGPKVVLYPSKRLRSQEDINFAGESPISLYPKGISSPTSIWTEESNGVSRLSDQNQEDGLAKAITLFVLALERVKSKIRLMTSKKSAEILSSIAEEIHFHMQHAESTIQRDVEKLTSVSKSKRKDLETEFEEQQDVLKVVYQKFKEEVNQHLQEWNSKIEGLETQEAEFKVLTEKQKTSQRKLLKQVEEVIETQLNDAQKRITAVHKLAAGKMLQLKFALSVCLKGGILS